MNKKKYDSILAVNDVQTGMRMNRVNYDIF